MKRHDMIHMRNPNRHLVGKRINHFGDLGLGGSNKIEMYLRGVKVKQIRKTSSLLAMQALRGRGV
jgi:hypothetical protein